MLKKTNWVEAHDPRGKKVDDNSKPVWPSWTVGAFFRGRAVFEVSIAQTGGGRLTRGLIGLSWWRILRCATCSNQAVASDKK
jgi:hypothetical protein